MSTIDVKMLYCCRPCCLGSVIVRHICTSISKDSHTLNIMSEEDQALADFYPIKYPSAPSAFIMLDVINVFSFFSHEKTSIVLR